MARTARLGKVVSNSPRLVSDEAFLLATRDTGYRSVATAVAELIDNSLDAGAEHLRVDVRSDDSGDLRVMVVDDGRGMDAATLASALQFGGSSRINDRTGRGRFGMGLPNSSVSQARRVEVHTWGQSRDVLSAYLDIDEILAGSRRGLRVQRNSSFPEALPGFESPSGTLVVWSKCDRLSARAVPQIIDELRLSLGRLFRYSLWDGVTIVVGDRLLEPFDPLFVDRRAALSGGESVGEPLSYWLRTAGGRPAKGCVRVSFSKLPVSKWHELPVETKRRSGIVKGAGVSVVRAGREIAYGWHFMGGKRRENYDDWWRCEVAFDPTLDEYFGVTHSKQEINPTAELERILVPTMEATAHALNARVRAEYAVAKSREGRAGRIASLKDHQLPAISQAKRPRHMPLLRLPYRLQYRLMTASLAEESFYTSRRQDGAVVLTLNREHPFFDRIYEPLRSGREIDFRKSLELLLLSLARVEVAARGFDRRRWYEEKRVTWSNILAAFLGG